VVRSRTLTDGLSRNGPTSRIALTLWSSRSALCWLPLFRLFALLDSSIKMPTGMILIIINLNQSNHNLIRLVTMISSFPAAFWDAMIALVLSVAVLLDAIFVSLGFSRWCRTVTQRFSACENAYNMTIVDDVKVDPSGFYLQIGCVQVSIFHFWPLLLRLLRNY
jgi:hypothetical protein